MALPTLPCLDGDSIAAFVAGTLKSPALDRVEAHLGACTRCSRVVADAAYGLMSADGESHELDSTDEGLRLDSWLPAPGDMLAEKYRIEERLGGGGMGDVFAAHHTELRLRVAIKILRSDDRDAEARFLREAQTCALLRNDHIPRVFDLGRLPGGAPYIVMECLAGEDLAQRIARGQLEPDQAAAYVLQACVALREAHAAGVVHRDIKPANLFLVSQTDAPPLLKVLDFGISKLATAPNSRRPPGSARLGLTAAGTIVGSPEYMSPEQVAASDTVDARADIWSLGVVLYQAIAGRPPFRASTFPALADAITRDHPPDLCVVRSGVPAGLQDAISKCLAKDPSCRFACVEDLARALAPYASREYAVLVPPALTRAPLARTEAVSASTRALDETRSIPPASPGAHEEGSFTRGRGPYIVPATALVLLSIGIGVLATFTRARPLGSGRPTGESATIGSAHATAGSAPAADDACAGQVAMADGRDALIDDVEDGNLDIRAADHRRGRWFVFGDKSCIMSASDPNIDHPEGANPSRFAAHVAARDCFEFGFGIGLSLNRLGGETKSCAYDASAYDGISLWARSGESPVTAVVGVVTRQTGALRSGGDGTCEPTCWDVHGAFVELTPAWKQYAIRWADLRQRGFGKPVPFDVKQVATIQLNIEAEPRRLREVWVDQVSFFKGAPLPPPFAATSTPLR